MQIRLVVDNRLTVATAKRPLFFTLLRFNYTLIMRSGESFVDAYCYGFFP